MADTELHEQIALTVKSLVPGVGRIVDYGAGEGALSARLNDLGFGVLSMDKDKEQFRGKTDFYAIDIDNADEVMRFRERFGGSFDVALGVEVIEHVENPWELIRTLKAVVRPGGYIVVSTPNITSWYSRMLFLFSGRFHQFEDHDRAYGHINPISSDELSMIASGCGLEPVSCRPGGWLPRLWLSSDPRTLSRNIIGFLTSFLMRGMRDGWCIVAVFRKPVES